MQKITLILIALCLALGGPGHGQIQEQSQPQQHLSTQEEPAEPEQHLPVWMEEEPSPQELPFPQIDPALMTGVRTVDGWVYFLYPYFPYEYIPDYVGDPYILCRQRPDGSESVQVSPRRCDYYDLVGDSVYFVSYPYMDHRHGEMYAIYPGQEPLLLEEDIGNYWLDGDTIYYKYHYDIMGVGQNGHSLHRMDLDGGNRGIAAYSIESPWINGNESWVRSIEDGYANYGNYRIKLGNPADGTEDLQLLAPPLLELDDGYFYYASNKLMKARPDGSGKVVLDSNPDNGWLFISSVEDGWVNYYTYGDFRGYKIRTDGTEKTEILQP